MANWVPGRRCLSCLQFLLLAVFQTDAYVSVNLERHCKEEGSPSVLFLQSRGTYAAAIVELNVKALSAGSEDLRCQLGIKAPPSHLLTVHLVQTQQKEFYRAPSSHRKLGFQPCFLKLSPQKEDDSVTLKRLGRMFDLCDSSEVPVNSMILTNNLILTWSPPDPSQADRMVASHLVITAVGRGPEICNNRNRMLCLSNSLYLCITSDLVCDGFHNCPNSNDDENPSKCSEAAALVESPHEVIGDFITNAFVRAISMKNDKSKESNTTGAGSEEKKSSVGLGLGPVFSDVSSFLLKSFLINNKNTRANPNITTTSTTTTTTTTMKPPWHQSPKNPMEMDSIPAVLAHYGPWGYLMLGMLICGAILLLCGLWECCCRSSKNRLPPGGPMSNSAATTVFIINSPPNRSNRNSSQPPEEHPPTPGPPSYEELDQPPSYSSLFPLTKHATSESIRMQENPVITDGHI